MLLLGSMAFSLAACGAGEQGGSTANGEGYELALITDVGTIDDKSFNQGSWEGLEKYAKDNNKTVKYYKPTEKSDEACMNAIDLAVKGGAKVVVTPGFLFEKSIFEKQKQYPDVNFVFIDGAPKETPESDYVVGENTLSIFYQEEQAGYLAGYAAVEEGYTKLGFMGGIAVPAVVRFGYGFAQGIDAAAKDLGISDVELKYTYLGNFDASPENMAKASAWYNEGTELIFGCGGGVGNSVMKAAETAGKKVIGVDVDQSGESETVITSAMKNLGKSVYDAVASYYDNKFEGGKMISLDAKSEGIQLPMETSKFTKFTQAKYDELYKKLADGEITVKNDTAGDSAEKLGLTNVKLTVIK